MGVEIFLSFQLFDEDCIRTESYVTVSDTGIFRKKKKKRGRKKNKRLIIYT